MGLESITYISDFNTSWPLSTDKRRQGDDHLRGIKLGVKNSFPNITGPMTKTQAQLNAIPEDIELIIPAIIDHLVPVGTIVMWDIINQTIPSGWHECDGSNVPGYGDVPDMRNLFVIGRGTLTAGQTGGEDETTSSLAGGHTPAIQGHILTAGEIPAHDHRLYTWETGSSSDANNFGTVNAKGIAGNTSGTFGYRSATEAGAGGNKLVENTGAAASAHTHTADAIGDHSHQVTVLPPYYVTVYIVKTSGYVAP